jgi:hypothetical protein
VENFNPNSSPNIIAMIKSKSTRWAGHVTSMKAKRSACKLFTENDTNCKDADVDGKIVVKRSFKK